MFEPITPSNSGPLNSDEVLPVGPPLHTQHVKEHVLPFIDSLTVSP